MKSILPVVLLFIFTINITGCKNREPKVEEIDITIKEVVSGESDYLISGTLWVQSSAEYRANCYQAFNYAKLALDNNLKTAKKDKPAAVVLDIDETILDNSYFEAELVQNNLSYSSDLWKEWTNKACATEIPGAKDFLDYARSLGVEIIYISNRKDHELNSTLKNLETVKFPHVKNENIYFRTEGTSSSKIDRRKSVSEKYNIILLIGDNLADFDGIFEDRSNNYGFNEVEENKELFGSKYIILPNPMYGNWDDQVCKDRKGSLKSTSELCNN